MCLVQSSHWGISTENRHGSLSLLSFTIQSCTAVADCIQNIWHLTEAKYIWIHKKIINCVKKKT